jgi:hypothetical protein
MKCAIIISLFLLAIVLLTGTVFFNAYVQSVYVPVTIDLDERQYKIWHQDTVNPYDTGSLIIKCVIYSEK